VIRERSDWAVAHGLLPEEYPVLIEALENAPTAVRPRVLNRLGLSYAAAGAYAEQVEVDRSLLVLRPNAGIALRRLVSMGCCDWIGRKRRGERSARCCSWIRGIPAHDSSRQRWNAMQGSGSRSRTSRPLSAFRALPTP
jgi:hypothetical protein